MSESEEKVATSTPSIERYAVARTLPMPPHPTIPALYLDIAFGLLFLWDHTTLVYGSLIIETLFFMLKNSIHCIILIGINAMLKVPAFASVAFDC